MARIRTIKPEFWQDEKIGSISVNARLLFIGMWNFADDSGIVRGHPIFLRSQVFPYDDFTKSDIESWIAEITDKGMISVFTVNSENFFKITNFLKHQIINKPSKNKNPQPTNDQSQDDNESLHDYPSIIPVAVTECSRSIPVAVTECSRSIPVAVTECSRTEREREREREREEELKASCPEPKKTGSEPETENVAKPETIFEIPIIGNNGKNAYHITQPMIDEWQKTYPAVDVTQAIRECRQWNIVNPNRRKTSSGIARHVVSWLQREQNSGGALMNVKRASPGLMKGQSKTYEHNVAAISQAMFELQQEVAATG